MPLSSNLKSRLPGIVLGILRNHSGGCKMTQLIVDLFQCLTEEDRKELSANLDEMENVIASSPRIGVLDYVHDLGGDGHGPYRSKSFVYTKSH